MLYVLTTNRMISFSNLFMRWPSYYKTLIIHSSSFITLGGQWVDNLTLLWCVRILTERRQCLPGDYVLSSTLSKSWTLQWRRPVVRRAAWWPWLRLGRSWRRSLCKDVIERSQWVDERRRYYRQRLATHLVVINKSRQVYTILQYFSYLRQWGNVFVLVYLSVGWFVC